MFPGWKTWWMEGESFYCSSQSTQVLKLTESRYERTLYCLNFWKPLPVKSRSQDPTPSLSWVDDLWVDMQPTTVCCLTMNKLIARKAKFRDHPSFLERLLTCFFSYPVLAEADNRACLGCVKHDLVNGEMIPKKTLEHAITNSQTPFSKYGDSGSLVFDIHT